MKNQEDIETLLQLKGGSRDALGLIFKKYWPQLYKLALKKLQTSTEAEEVVQELFVSIWEKRERLEINNLEHYLSTAVRNRIINKIKTDIVKKKSWEAYSKFIPQYEEAGSDLAFDELNNEVERIVASMPQKTQKIFKWNRMDGVPVATIATRLKLSEKAVEYHITKSLKEIRLYLHNIIF